MFVHPSTPTATRPAVRSTLRGTIAPVALIIAGLALVGLAIVVPGSAGAAPVGPGSTIAVANTPYASSSGGCDPTRDGWHIVLVGLSTGNGQPPTAGDFGSVALTFADGSTGTAAFTDVSSGSVAHFLDASTNQNGPATITAASMTCPPGTNVAGFVNFVISHPPCGTNPTTTTTNPVVTTSTTSNPVVTTSTTSNPSNTTTTANNPSNTTTTTNNPSGVPLPGGSGGSGGLAGSGAGGGGSGSTNWVQAARTSGLLPVTGVDVAVLAIAGLAMFTGGLGLHVAGRRKTPL